MSITHSANYQKPLNTIEHFVEVSPNGGHIAVNIRGVIPTCVETFEFVIKTKFKWLCQKHNW